MKTRFIKSLITVLLLIIGGTVFAEDFATVYFHDGTHKKFFLKDIEGITVSKKDVSEVLHDSYQTQLVETKMGVYYQDISQIDSVVFSTVDMAYPRTDQELESTTQLATNIAERTNAIVESLENEGQRDMELIVKEFMKIPGVIDAEVNEDQYSITMLRVDSIYHFFNFNKESDDISQKQRFFVHKTPPKDKNQIFIPQNKVSLSQMAQTVPLHEDGEPKTIKDIKSVLILAPFENMDKNIGGYPNDLAKLGNDIKELLNVEPKYLLDNEADIKKFYGELLDNYDMIIISTHGVRDLKEGVNLCSYSTEKDNIKNLPVIRYMTIYGNKNSFYCMTEKFLDKASFNGSVVFAYACNGFDGMYAENSMTRAFLEKGANFYFGAIESVMNRLNKSVSNNIVRSFCAGIPLQDAFSYWKNCSQTKYFYDKEKEYKNNNNKDNDWIRTQDPEILKQHPKTTNPIYSKSPYPYNLNYDILNDVFSWECLINPFTSSMNLKINGDGIDEFQHVPVYDVYVNGTKINDKDITGNRISWISEKKGSNKWYVVAKMKSEDYGEYISTFKSKEEIFTIEDYPPLILSFNSFSLKVGESTTVDITSGSVFYSVESIIPQDVVTAEISGNGIAVNAMKAGTATITVKDNKSGQTANIAVTVTAADNPTTDAIAVDLGLPSGTVWADRNVGAASPEDYGGYYAWGETEEKDVYDWSTYIHCDGTINTFHNLGWNIAGTEYDVAHVKWGEGWKMPTANQVNELCSYCTFRFTTSNGINCCKIFGPNGNSILLPLAGARVDEDYYNRGSWGCSWSGSYHSNYQASHLEYWDFGDDDCDIFDCCCGFPIRPVTIGLKISANFLLIDENNTGTIAITSGNGKYTAASSNAEVATANVNDNMIIVHALKPGVAFITITDSKTKQTAAVKVNVVAAENLTGGKLNITANGVSFTMVKVEGGTFQMGSTPDNADEKPVHEVTLTNDYYIGETEVTQELWKAVMGSNPSKFTDSNQLPVERVSWNDCQTFITKLNSLTGLIFRLPTEAEWEFAARGGKASLNYTYCGSNSLGDVGWYSRNSRSKTHEVATKAPNELGLYDMSGNVEEMCQDWYDSYNSGAQTNPTGPFSGYNRVVRGGSWDDYTNCRLTSRHGCSEVLTREYRGLRLAM